MSRSDDDERAQGEEGSNPGIEASPQRPIRIASGLGAKTGKREREREREEQP